MTTLYTCIVCELTYHENQAAPDIQPGDKFICLTCGKVTFDLAQARQHWNIRQTIRKRHKAIEKAALRVCQHLEWLESQEMLMRKEEAHLEELRQALR